MREFHELTQDERNKLLNGLAKSIQIATMISGINMKWALFAFGDENGGEMVANCKPDDVAEALRDLADSATDSTVSTDWQDDMPDLGEIGELMEKLNPAATQESLMRKLSERLAEMDVEPLSEVAGVDLSSIKGVIFSGPGDMLHRDDLPMDVAETMVNKLKQMFPGKKVMFAGDATPEAKRAMEKGLKQLNAKFAERYESGKCMDCEWVMPDWEPDCHKASGWKPAPGWRYLTAVGGSSSLSPAQWLCPECDQKDEGPMVIRHYGEHVTGDSCDQEEGE